MIAKMEPQEERVPKKRGALQPDLFLNDTLNAPKLDVAEQADVVRQLRTLLEESMTAQATEARDDADNA